MRVRVTVPGSTSNLGPGFDCLGLALDCWLRLEVETGIATPQVVAAGETLPAGAPNLAHQNLLRALHDTGWDEQPLGVRVASDIPIGRGLGSSGAAVVAGLVAGHLVATRHAPDLEAILRQAVEIEGHPDNVAASVWGGLVASAVDASGVHTARFPVPKAWTMVAVIPDARLDTPRARAALPKAVPLADAVFNMSHLALLLGAASNGDEAGLSAALADRLHQDVRLGLVPGLRPAWDALRGEPGCIGAVVSGSGPTLLAFTRPGARGVGAAAVAAWAHHGVQATVRSVQPVAHGVTWDGL